MSQTLGNIWLIATTEIKRTIVTKKGLISLAAFSLVWLLLLLTVIYRAPVLIANGSSIGSMFGFGKVTSLLQWKTPELGAYWFISLYLFPLCTVVFAADQTASDKTRGTLKILTLHTSRTSLFFGRFTGLMLVQGLIIALTLLSAIVVAAVRDLTLLRDAPGQAGFIWINLMVVIAPYTALMALISLFAKSGMQAVNYAVILWILILLAIYLLSKYFPEAQLLKGIFPGAQVGELVQHYNWSALKTMIIPSVQTLVFLSAGLFFMHRIDL